MGKVYTSTFNINCRKEHNCAGCGAVFSYPFVRKIKGQGRNPAAAQVQAQRKMDRTLKEDVDLHPCPTCGLYQPDMVAKRRLARHKLITWIGITVLVIAAIVKLAYGMQANVATFVIAGIAAVLFLAHLMVEMQNPNRDLSSNARRGADAVAGGVIFHTAGRSEPLSADLIQPPRSLLHVLALPLILLGVLLIVMPEGIRAINHWPINSDSYPPVLGPGDQSRIYMDEKITSVKGFWRGQPSAIFKDGSNEIKAAVSTNENDWGSTISVKSDEKNNSVTPWVEVTVPEGVVGKVVDCAIEINVAYPSMSGDSSFTELHSSMQRNVSLSLAPPHAGSQYVSWWWSGTVAGIALVTLDGFVLIGAARNLRSRANPTRVFTTAPVAPPQQTVQQYAAPAYGAQPPPLPPQMPR